MCACKFRSCCVSAPSLSVFLFLSNSASPPLPLSVPFAPTFLFGNSLQKRLSLNQRFTVIFIEAVSFHSANFTEFFSLSFRLFWFRVNKAFVFQKAINLSNLLSSLIESFVFVVVCLLILSIQCYLLCCVGKSSNSKSDDFGNVKTFSGLLTPLL